MLERSLYHYREVGLLFLRLTVGIIFLIHGYDKIFQGDGLGGTAKQFSELGFFFPLLFAWLVAWGELIGGGFLLIGLLTRECSLYLAVIMVGAIWTVHFSNGFFIANKGYEYNLALIGACLCLLFSGGGTGSLDKVIFPRARWTFISDPSKVRLEPPEHPFD
ncbi:MAG: DoxX family protein [Candidatus Omnitrophica bacterium]|nr:DoxX family protein [Candidatus Omnitrophota bacterium]